MKPIDGRTQLDVGYGDGAWSDVTDIAASGSIIRAAFLPFGTEQGNPTIELLIELPDGKLVHANTTWRLWKGATEAFQGWSTNGPQTNDNGSPGNGR